MKKEIKANNKIARFWTGIADAQICEI